jgi:hypothetical protein
VVFGGESGDFVVIRNLHLFGFHLADAAAAGTDGVMMGQRRTFQLIFNDSGSNLVADNQTGVHQQFDGIVYGGPADAEMVFFHVLPQRFHIEMPLYAADTFQNGITFHRLSKRFLFQIAGKDFPHFVGRVHACAHFPSLSCCR